MNLDELTPEQRRDYDTLIDNKHSAKEAWAIVTRPRRKITWKEPKK